METDEDKQLIAVLWGPGERERFAAYAKASKKTKGNLGKITRDALMEKVSRWEGRSSKERG